MLENTVRWVLTVPAIWKQPAKQFMREAAYLVRTCRGNCASLPPPGCSPYLIHPSTLRTTEPSCEDSQHSLAGGLESCCTWERERLGLQEQGQLDKKHRPLKIVSWQVLEKQRPR